MLKSWKLSNSPKTWNSPSPKWRGFDEVFFQWEWWVLKGRKVGINITPLKKWWCLNIIYLKSFLSFWIFSRCSKVLRLRILETFYKKRALDKFPSLAKVCQPEGTKTTRSEDFLQRIHPAWKLTSWGNGSWNPIIYDEVVCYIPGGCLGFFEQSTVLKKKLWHVGSHRLNSWDFRTWS